MKTYHYELYTTGPEGQKGWEIETGWAKADSLQNAKAKIKACFLGVFDCFINVYHANMNKDDKVTIS